MASRTIVTGDDVSFAVQLTKNDATFNIPGTAVVNALLREEDTVISSQENCYSYTPGADWTTSLVVALFPSAVTNRLPSTRTAVLEIQVTDNSGTTTWLYPGVEIKQGKIPQ